MENASDAIMIAGSLLLALIIITALVFTFQKINNSEDISSQVTEEEQINDFNKEFTSFEKDLYGSELLSIINKALDYNIRYADTEGYKKIGIKVTIKNGTGSNRVNSQFAPVGTFTIYDADSNKLANNLLNGISDIKEKYHGDVYLERLVSLYDTYYYGTGVNQTNAEYDIKMMLDELGIGGDRINNTTVKKEIQQYTEYVEFKRKKFEWKGTRFDGDNGTPGNGRVTEMTFYEITI